MGSYDHGPRTPFTIAWHSYLAFCGEAGQRRSPGEVQTAVQAAGVAYEDVDAGFWHCLRADWLGGDQDLQPFEDAAGANQGYQLLAELRGLLPSCFACGSPLPPSSQAFCGLLCGRAWQYRHEHEFTAPPLAMPQEHWETFAALLTGRPVSPEYERSLQAWLDAEPLA